MKDEIRKLIIKKINELDQVLVNSEWQDWSSGYEQGYEAGLIHCLKLLDYVEDEVNDKLNERNN